ncbi:hypothetical protein [Nocardioides pantholopis]|uniref:hypothetical protein n=1 Tax=Nocardioides pantholopis TaxID=2483798 RepID=UPI001F14FC53|nr:hypothetical protein [Nocardioides pantholopis]
MTSHTPVDTTVAGPETPAGTHPGRLRRLYYARFGFAVVWAALLAVTGATITPVSAALLVLYPSFDAAAAIVDLRAAAGRLRRLLYLNLALSVLTAVGLAVAAASGIPGVLRVWGAWAIAAGLVQLVVAGRRRREGGQWPMILSGAISVLAGAGFVAMAGGSDASLTALAGYATLGGVFFLVSAIRLGRGTGTPPQ